MRKALKNATEEGIPLNEALANLEATIVNGTDGVDGLTAAYDLFGKSGDQIYSAVKTGTLSFQDLAGASVDAGNSVSDTFEATLDPVDKFKLALQNLQIVGAEVGAELLDVFTPAIEKLGEIIEKAGTWWEGLSPDMQDMIIKFALVAAAVGPVLTVFGQLAGLVSTLGPVIGGALAAAAPVVAAIAAIVAIGVILYKNWDKIKAKAIELFNNLKKTFQNIKEKVVTIVQNMRQAIADKIDALKSKVQSVFDTIKEKIITPIQNAKQRAVDAIQNLRTSISSRIEAIRSKVSSVFESIKEKITSPIEKAKEIVEGAIDKIKGFFPFNLGNILNLKLPHISVSGGEAPFGIMGKGKLPSFSVEWYKTGGIFNKPNIIGVGEAGSEAVVPLDKFWNKLDRLNGGNTINMNITVNGTDSPEKWAHELVKRMKLEMRSM